MVKLSVTPVEESLLITNGHPENKDLPPECTKTANNSIIPEEGALLSSPEGLLYLTFWLYLILE